LLALSALSATHASISARAPGMLTVHPVPAATSTPNSISGGGPG